MAKFTKTLIAAGLLAASATPALAADYSGDIHKNDYKVDAVQRDAHHRPTSFHHWC